MCEQVTSFKTLHAHIKLKLKSIFEKDKDLVVKFDGNFELYTLQFRPKQNKSRGGRNINQAFLRTQKCFDNP